MQSTYPLSGQVHSDGFLPDDFALGEGEFVGSGVGVGVGRTTFVVFDNPEYRKRRKSVKISGSRI